MIGTQVTQDALAEVPATDALTEGGGNLSEQRCTFLELALALAGSLDTAAIGMLYKAIKPALQVRPPNPGALQRAASASLAACHLTGSHAMRGLMSTPSAPLCPALTASHHL